MSRNGALRGIQSDALRTLARDAIRQGFDLNRLGTGHLSLSSPTGGSVTFSSTTGDRHAILNTRKELRRVGFEPLGRRRARALAMASVAPGLGSPTPSAPIPAPVAEHPLGEPHSQESTPMESPAPTAEATSRGQSYKGKGKSVSAYDRRILGQPFRFRTDSDGGVAMTTLRRRPQRTWSSKGGDLEHLRDKAEQFVAEAGGWEEHDPVTEPMPTIERPTNGAAEARPPGWFSVVDRVLGEEPKPEPELEPVGDPIWVAARVDPAEFPIAHALDQLQRAVEPAIAALEAAGKQAAAQLVRDELDLTPAEAELLALWQEVNNRPRLERPSGDLARGGGLGSIG